MTATTLDDGRLVRLRSTEALGITRVESYAWRDLDDAEAGGSELHADEIFRRWAAVGHRHRPPHLDGRRAPTTFERNGYRRRSNEVAASTCSREWRCASWFGVAPPSTATIEIWNGVPVARSDLGSAAADGVDAPRPP